MFIDERNPKYRQEMIEYLEDRGYCVDTGGHHTRAEIINDILPIAVVKKEKKYRMMGNRTCAAAAASGGGLKTREELYQYIK